VTPLPAVPPEHRLSTPDPMPPSPGRSSLCAVPGCGRRSQQRHHIVKRSEGGDFILIDDVYLVQNVADLCYDPHHMGVESGPGGCIYRIRWLGEAGWGWYRRAKEQVYNENAPHGTHAPKDKILWQDPKSDTLWEFRGFLKGDEWVTKL
jgi:hypothetical protein